jgi:sodium-dependent dicarboxylate transporter 2/3/5
MSMGENNGGLKLRLLLIAIILAAVAYLIAEPLEGQARTMLAIAVFTGAMWATEALPLHVTALLGTVLAILFVPIGTTEAFAPYFSPVVVLLLGGLALARAMEKHGLDRKMASWMLSRFGNEPRMFLLGLMVATAFLSFWISNTATAAIMLPIAISVLAASGAAKKGSSYAKATVIAVGFAATIGGMATLVGTPPNAIAVANLAERSITVSFFDWAYHGLPFVALLIPLAWLVITSIHRPEIKKVKMEQEKKMGGNSAGVLAIGALTALLWMTSSYHGIPDAVVSVLALVALYVAGLLDRNDIARMDWAILLLVGGSLGLAYGIGVSGLSGYMASALASIVSGQGEIVLLVGVALFTIVVTSFMSNTSTAALVVPIVAAMPLGGSVRELVILAGMASSLNFLTPAGTPPSAMAYSSGYITVWDMVKPGVVITIIAVLLLVFLAWLYW